MNAVELFIAATCAASLAAVAYSYALYPALIWLAARTLGDRSLPAAMSDAELPTVTLLIAAYNERSTIEARLHNALACDYPTGRLRVVVASDGSDDGTNAIVGAFAHRGVQLLSFPQRRGKAAALNDAVAHADGELLVLSDANTQFDADAVRRLAAWFHDDRIGVVCGRLVLVDAATGRNVDGLYWRYETFLKRCEATLGALLGSNGAIYALRRDHYQPIPPGTIVDDFVIPLLATLRTGCRIAYDARAVAREETAPSVAAEFRRRARIGAGGFQAIGLLWRLMSPRHGWLALAFVSHKLLRWLCPFFLLGGLAGSAALAAHHGAFRALLAAQLTFYAAALVGLCAPAAVQLPRLIKLAAMFTSMNAALLVGFWRWARDLQGGTWTPTPRTRTA